MNTIACISCVEDLRKAIDSIESKLAKGEPFSPLECVIDNDLTFKFGRYQRSIGGVTISKFLDRICKSIRKYLAFL